MQLFETANFKACKSIEKDGCEDKIRIFHLNQIIAFEKAFNIMSTCENLKDWIVIKINILSFSLPRNI